MFNFVDFYGSSDDEDGKIREINIYRRHLRDISNPLELPAHM